MTTIMKSDSFELGVNGSGIDVTSHEDRVCLYVPLTPAERRTMAAALDPDREHPLGEMWTRDDLPRVSTLGRKAERASPVLDAVVAHLNAHHPKVNGNGDAHTKVEGLRESCSRWSDIAERLERERDAAVARAEKSEKRHTWPKTTPTGHTYIAPDTYSALCHQHGNAAQAAVESWDADECPPEPTWEMVGIAHREVQRLQRDRDEWKARAERAERERDEADRRTAAAEADRDRWKLHHDRVDGQWAKAEREVTRLRGTGAVTKADIEKAVSPYVLDRHHLDTITIAVWALVSGTDPAVHVVRESHVQAVEVERFGSQRVAFGQSAGSPGQARERAQECLRYARGFEAIAQNFEAEQAVDPDPVEAKARELYEAVRIPDWRDWDQLPPADHDEYYRLARHVLGQETGQ